MSRIIFKAAALFLFMSNVIYGQSKIAIQSSKNIDLIKALNNVELLAENSEEWLGVRVYRLDNGVASAGYPSSEVSYNLLVAVSQMDDAPEQHVYQVGPFHNPSFGGWDYITNYRKEFSIIHGTASERDTLGFEIKLKELAIHRVSDIAYEWGELDIEVNGYSVNRPYDKREFEDTVGNNFTEFVDTNDTILLEFQHNIYEYYYGNSSIIIDDEYGISDIQIKDASLAINGIKVGDSIEKVKRTFSKYQVYADCLRIWHSDYPLSYYFDENGIITRIFYFVPT